MSLSKIALTGVLFLGAARAEPLFDFHSNFWVNLHHYLYQQVAAPYYRELAKHDLLTREMEAINNRLADLEGAATLKGSGLAPELIAALGAAAPAYKTGLWIEHNRGNLAWIEAVKPLIAKHGAALSKELAAAYETAWPDGPIRVDVAEHAGWSGAYTTLKPTHITISSIAPGNQGASALEILFHEASHSLIEHVEKALSAEAAAQNKLFQRRAFWHAVLFYTAGELTRRRLDGYTPYAIKNGLYDRGWAGALPVLEKDWKPYLDGKIDFTTAVQRMVADYGVPRTP